jgi:hypothetical protein
MATGRQHGAGAVAGSVHPYLQAQRGGGAEPDRKTQRDT